ncbi:MAG: YdcF family protein [Ilumatobacteraceae bacterium]
MQWIALTIVGVVGAVVLGAELLHWSAARTRAEPQRHGDHALVVLGFPSRRGGGTRALQRWRVDLALRAVDQLGCDRVVFTGGTPTTDHVEAITMAANAAEKGLDPSLIVIEPLARSTWENVSFSAALVADREHVALVSDPMHARRAQRYWRQQFPGSRVPQIAPGGYRLLERWWLKVPTAAGESWFLLRDRVSGR